MFDLIWVRRVYIFRFDFSHKMFHGDHVEQLYE